MKNKNKKKQNECENDVQELNTIYEDLLLLDEDFFDEYLEKCDNFSNKEFFTSLLSHIKKTDLELDKYIESIVVVMLNDVSFDDTIQKNETIYYASILAIILKKDDDMFSNLLTIVNRLNMHTPLTLLKIILENITFNIK